MRDLPATAGTSVVLGVSGRLVIKSTRSDRRAKVTLSNLYIFSSLGWNFQANRTTSWFVGVKELNCVWHSPFNSYLTLPFPSYLTCPPSSPSFVLVLSSFLSPSLLSLLFLSYFSKYFASTSSTSYYGGEWAHKVSSSTNFYPSFFSAIVPVLGALYSGP